MSKLREILDFNEKFVENKEYLPFETTGIPNKKLVILTCMDTRLVELLHQATNTKNGDIKIVKSAGGVVYSATDSIMRSLLVAVYELQADEVLVIGHHNCGMQGLTRDHITNTMKNRGISEETFETLEASGFPLDQFLTGFETVQESVKNSVSIIKNHPLLVESIPVHGMVIDPATGKLDLVVDGYDK